MVWKDDPTGCYSVRSGYRLLHWPMQQVPIPYSPSNPLSSRDLFTTIWKVRVPPKVHIIVWRFLCNYVPTLHNLYNRYISTTQFCPRCLNILETLIHMLRDCPFAISVWNQLLVSWDGTYNDSNLVSWLGFLCQAHTWDKLAFILTTIWALWWSYDRYYHESLGSTSINLVCFIRSYMGGLSVLAMPGTIPRVLRTTCWHPPSAPLVKANFDAAYRRGSHSSCSGMVVSSALEFARDLGLARVVFEGDSLHFVITSESIIELLTNPRRWDFVGHWIVSGLRRFRF
ncbi:hypothetical protein Godav_015460, partial [Gossypium davidsonii]|nr:hypothetical protein [Gossypium davidsonii]